MAASNAPRPTGQDYLRFGLMAAGLRMWDAREQSDHFPQARNDLVEFCVACEAMALTRVLHTFLAAHDHHEQLLLTGGSGGQSTEGHT